MGRGMEEPPLNLHLDTQAAVFLSAGETERFTPEAIRTIEEATVLYLSPMALLEIEYLFERGRITADAASVFADLAKKIGMRVSAIPMSDIVWSSLDLKWTRDPFDRLITATAIADNWSRLLTSDQNIQNNYSGSVRMY